MELVMAQVIAGLTNGEMRHDIACLKGEPQIADRLPGETDIHCLHARPNEPQLPVRLAALIRKIRPTVIHARNWGAWPDVAVARLLARPIVPLILSFHGLDGTGKPPLRRRLASKVLARTASYLFTLSKRSKDLLVAEWGWPEARVNIIPNGVDTHRFRPCQKHVSYGRIVVGSVGRLRPVKNHGLLIRACASLARQGTDLELRIAGEGEDRANALQLAHQLGFSERLKLYGYVEDVAGFLNQLDVFVLPSNLEQHPNALTEAMAYGVASIATRVGCVEELMDGGRCGVIVAPGDVQGLERALLFLIKNPDARVNFASVAREHVSTNYSLKRMLAAYRRMYLEQAGVGTACT
jgi:glycosyltransferase involved in cell wall biosynthesis